MKTIQGAILLSAMLQWSSAAKIIPTFAGPYMVHVDKVLPCVGAPLNWTFSLRTTHYNPHKPNEKQNITGHITFTDAFDDTEWVDVRLALRANNEWKQNAFVMRWPSKACSTFRTDFPSFFFSLFKGASRTGVCSFPPGAYHVNDPVDWTFPRIKVFPYGNYLASLSAGRAGSRRPSLCVEFYSHWLPKAGA